MITYTDLSDSFKKHQIDGYLNRDRFNETILSVLRFDIPVISYTYLSERLFDLQDASSDGRIQEDEFINGMKNVFASKEIREKCIIVCNKVTFMAMMRKRNIKNSTIDFSEIFEYYFNCWIYAFRILSNNITRDKSNIL